MRNVCVFDPDRNPFVFELAKKNFLTNYKLSTKRHIRKRKRIELYAHLMTQNK